MYGWDLQHGLDLSFEYGYMGAIGCRWWRAGNGTVEEVHGEGEEDGGGARKKTQSHVT